MNIGDNLKIKWMNGKHVKQMKGKVVAITRHFFVLKNKKYKEAFQFCNPDIKVIKVVRK